MQPPLKFQWHFIQKLGKNIKIHMEPQKTLNSTNTLENEEQSWRHQLSDFKLYYKVTVIKIVDYCIGNCIDIKTEIQTNSTKWRV